MDYMPFLILAGAVALLMYGMKVMSEGLQKLAGGKLRKVLGTMTTNRFTGILTGAFVTASIQSSTGTTVMTVSFVSAGLLTLAQAISVIMGANIGTTATAWIMVLGGSSSYMTYVIYGMIVMAMAFIYNAKNRNLGEFLMGLSLMLLGLTTLSANAKSMNLEQNMAIQQFFASLSSHGYASYFLFLFVGGALTFAVQSSAAIMAITMTLCSSGVLDIYMGIALVMGENIGTTITSNIVALSASTQARRAAMAHLIFNLFGVCWVLLVFPHFVEMVCGFVGYDPQEPITDRNILNAVLAAFHTTFNVCNMLILVWFVRLLEKTVTLIIPAKKDGEQDDFRLRFISNSVISTAELSILEARKEINLFAERIQRMFAMVEELLHTGGMSEFNKLFTRIEKYENISDNMELEIANYLNQVSEGRLSSESKLAIRGMLREISEIESIGDSCYNLARTISRKHKGTQDFTDNQYRHIHQMFQLTDRALTQMVKLVSDENSVEDVNKSFNIEMEINNFRSELKEQNYVDINNKAYDYTMGANYMDIICECERLGDYVVNVCEAHSNVKERKDS
ncbi:MAG: Na/Pi cotransporter family protein [Bacteroidales bacterium]|nr:Na/Pi cotransporter family protein [Bacteroidales bacterium]